MVGRRPATSMPQKADYVAILIRRHQLWQESNDPPEVLRYDQYRQKETLAAYRARARFRNDLPSPGSAARGGFALLLSRLRSAAVRIRGWLRDRIR